MNQSLEELGIWADDKINGKYLSEKLKGHKYLIKCLVLEGIPGEDTVVFPCYDKKDGRLGVECISCHPDYIDTENGFCRTDFLRKEGNKGLVYMNGETFRISLDSLVENL